MKTRIGLCASVLAILLLSSQPISSFVPPEEITLMTVPKAALYWLVAHEFNTMDMTYGKYVAADLLHTNSTVATTVALDMKHLFNAIWREIMVRTAVLPEANNYLKQGTSEAEIADFDKALAISTARPATMAGLAYDSGRAYLTIKDFYLSTMQTVQKWLEYEAQKMAPAPGTSAHGNQVALAQEPASVFSPNTWKQTMYAIALDPMMLFMGLTYFFAGFYVNKACQLTGPAFRAIITKNNAHLWAANTDPSTRIIDTITAYPMTVFAKPYVEDALSTVRSTATSLISPFVTIPPTDPEAEAVYDSAYISGDKGLFGYYGIKGTVAVISMLAGALWARYHPAHAHAN